MKHHVRGYLEDNSPDTAILHFGTNNLKESENEGDIATDIMNLEISVKNKKKTVVSGIAIQNDTFNDKGKIVNILLKRKFEEEKKAFVDNSKITVSILNNSRLYLTKRGTMHLGNNSCSSFTEMNYLKARPSLSKKNALFTSMKAL